MAIFEVLLYVEMDLKFSIYFLQMIVFCFVEQQKLSAKILWTFWRYIREDSVKK